MAEEWEVSANDVEAWVRLWLRNDGAAANKNKSRAAIDRAMQISLDEGELDLAAQMMFILAARIVNHQHETTGLLLQAHVDLRSPLITKLIESN
jgi:hypothetical protein